jgi:hypothetical protein
LAGATRLFLDSAPAVTLPELLSHDKRKRAIVSRGLTLPGAMALSVKMCESVSVAVSPYVLQAHPMCRSKQMEQGGVRRLLRSLFETPAALPKRRLRRTNRKIHVAGVAPPSHPFREESEFTASCGIPGRERLRAGHVNRAEIGCIIFSLQSSVRAGSLGEPSRGRRPGPAPSAVATAR